MTKHLLYCPLLGLGKIDRGPRWLADRIVILKKFVVPSLQNQNDTDFILWISVRAEDRTNTQIKELRKYFEEIKEFKTVFTFSGLCFFDDKFSNEIARDRLLTALHGSMGELVNAIGECDSVLMTIQPSDDMYFSGMVEGTKRYFQNNPEKQAVGFKRGYICNYLTKEVAEYNPLTNPPFYTIKFPRDVFIEPIRHAEFTGIKYNYYNKKYPLGTPLPSHEYLRDVFGDKYGTFEGRGFLVGCHGRNISTNFNIPYKGRPVSQEILRDFGVSGISPLEIKSNWGRRLWLKLPHKVQRKIRFWRYG